MTALAWYLLAVVLLSAVTFFFVRWWSGPVGQGDPKPFLLAHTGLVVGISIIAVLYFLGWQAGGAAPKKGTAPFRLEHTGFYTAEDEPLSFRGSSTERAAYLSVLRPDESFTLTPQASGESPASKPIEWQLAGSAWSLPLRLDGTCINLPDAQWFEPGDTLLVEDREGRQFFSVEWKATQHGELLNRWFYNQGILQSGQHIDDLTEGVVIEDRPLREGLRLSYMAEHRMPQAIRRLEGSGKTEEPSWLGRLLGRAPARPLELRSGASLSGFRTRYRRLARLFHHILWVRKSLGDLRSPVGVFLDPELFAGYRVFHVSGSGRVQPLAPPLGRQPFQQRLAPATLLRYGFGSRATGLRLGSERQDVPELGLVVDIDLDSPNAWQLPDDPSKMFMIFSQEVQIPVPGYLVDVGFDREPFYAKASYLSGKDAFEINDGRDFLGALEKNGQRLVRSGETFRLGGSQHGTVMRLLRQGSPVSYPGERAVILLLLAAAAFALDFLRDHLKKPRLDLSWTLLWGFVLSILVVRLVLAYRVGALPPTDATPQEIENVFRKSFRIALYGLGWLPLLLVGLRVMARGPRPVVRLEQKLRSLTSRRREAIVGRAAAKPQPRDEKPRRFSGWITSLPPGLIAAAIALSVWILLGKLFGANEAFLGVRINLIAHLLIIAGLAASATWITRQRLRRRGLFAGGWLLIPALVIILVTGDLGFGIFLLTYLFVALLLLVWDRQTLRWITVVSLLGLVVLLACMPAFLPQLLEIPQVDRFVARAFDPATSHVYYRLALPEAEDALLVRPAEEDEYSATYFLRNSQQHWQMLLYAAEGAHHPKGYGGVPLSQAGMNYPTSMSDCVFAIYLVSEHGPVAALCLLLIYAGIGGVLVYASAFLIDARNSRALALTAIGATFALSALFMTSANLGLLVFTGQNLPLLSLVSRSDLVVNAALLGLAAVLLRFRLNADRREPFRHQPWVRRLAFGYLGLLLIGWVAVGIRMYDLAADPAYRKDFSLPEAVLRQFHSHLPETGKSKPLTLVDDELRVRAPEALSWLEKQFIRRFSLQSDRYDPLSGLYYLEDTGDQKPQLQINASYFNLSSPFVPPSPWPGQIEAQGRELPTINLLGEGISVRPGRESSGQRIPLNATDWNAPDALPASEVSAAVVLTWELAHGLMPLCELRARGESFSITPFLSDGRNGVSFDIFVDGHRIVGTRELQGKEVIRISGAVETRKGRSPQRFSYSLMYLGRQRPLLAFSTWRNGAIQRVVAEGSLSSLVQSLGKALDARHAEQGIQLPEPRIVLSLQDSLHRQLERTLRLEAEKIYKPSDPPYRRHRVSLSVLDATSGELLALPFLPAWTAEQSPSRSGQAHHRYLRNESFRNHVIGSTIKPLLLSAVATGYWPAGFDVGKLTVRHVSDCSMVTDPSAIHPHCRIAGVELDAPWDCGQATGELIDEREFLVHSRNFYAGVLGMLGMAINPADWRTVLRHPNGATGETGVVYDGTPFRVDLSQAPADRTVFTFEDSSAPLPKPKELGETLLFRQIPALFHAKADLDPRDEKAYRAFMAEEIGSLYPDLASLSLEKAPDPDSLLPDVLNLRPGAFLSTRADLLSFLLGAGTNGRWNNIRMAESFARLATGHKLLARLTAEPKSKPQASANDSLPAPLSIPDWRERYILRPLTEVGLVGTASDLKPWILEQQANGYRILIKTGTMEELPPPAGSTRKRFESELLLFVVGRSKDGVFVPGETLAGMLYLEDSKLFETKIWNRISVAQPILEILVKYLQQRQEASAPMQEAGPSAAAEPHQRPIGSRKP
jgi:cell division protein FtsW (lipid II flippase)